MTRTALFLSLAAGLCLVSLLATPPPPQPEAGRRQVASPTRSVEPVPQPSPLADLPFTPVTAEDGVLKLEARLSNSYVAQGSSEQVLEVNLAASETRRRGQRVPVNLALVLDRSGSMAGQKLAEAKRAAHELVGQLGPSDRLAIVAFGSDVTTLESQRGDGAGRERLDAFIDSVHESGGTNIYAALESALRLVAPLGPSFKASRIILISDGQPTEGVVDGPSLGGQVSALRQQGFTVSAIGVGVDFNGPMMRDFAARGGGFYGFIDDAERLAEVFRRELDEAGQAVARDVALELELPAGVELVEVWGRRAERVGTHWQLPLYDFSPGQSTRVSARLTVRTGGAVNTRLEVATVRLRYLDLLSDHRVASASTLVATVSDDPKRVRSLDARVKENADRAVSAQQLTLAAAAFERGDRASAFGLLDNVRAMFGASADALAGEDLGALRGRWESARSEHQVRYEAKNIEKKAMKNFGENNAY